MDQLKTLAHHNEVDPTLDPIMQAPQSRLDASREVGGENQGYDDKANVTSKKELVDEPLIYPTPPLETLGSPDVLDTIIVRTAGSIDQQEASQPTTESTDQVEHQEAQEQEPQGTEVQGLQEAQVQQNQELRGLQDS